MAKKKAVKKKKAAKKKTAKKTSARMKVVKITYKCSGGCKASKKFAHMSPGDHVSLEASGTTATIQFVTRTPFTSGDMHIVVRDGHPVPEVVKATAFGTYEYSLGCDSCRSAFSNPKMIVP